MGRPVTRSPKVQTINLTLDKEALHWLRQGASTSKNVGQFISRLAYEDRARREARAEKDVAYAEILKLYGLPQKNHEVALEK